LKKPVFILLLLIFIIQAQRPCYAQGSWERIEVPTLHDLNSIFFVDSITGWAVGDSGTILHTSNGGVEWRVQQSHTANDIVYVFFLNDQVGWASSINFSILPYGTLLLKTTNGGEDWTSEVYPTENIFISCILFLDSLNGWMGGIPHALVHTTDGGNQWHQADIDTSTLAFFPVLSIQFYNEQYGYASGGIFDIAGVTWHTSNGGEKWYAIESNEAPADEVHALHLFDSTHVMGVGGDPDFGYGVGLLRTFNGGSHWEYEEIGIQGNAWDVDFVNSNEVWAPLGNRRKFIYSTDTGSTWTQISTPDETAIYDVTFPDSLHGYAAGDEGAMLRFKPVTPVGFEITEDLSKGFVLYQNYPNPFKSHTMVAFHIPIEQPDNALVQIKIYTIEGNEVALLMQENCSSGKHHMDIDTTGWPGGIYYYRLTVGNTFVGTRRMVLMP